MPIEYTRKGYHVVLADGVEISRHSSLTEPYESAANWALENPDAVVTIQFAPVEVTMLLPAARNRTDNVEYTPNPAPPNLGDNDADFASRATASTDVLYATNFTDVYYDGVIQPARAIASGDSAALRAEAFEIGPGGSSYTNASTSTVLSGSNSVEITTLGTSYASSQGYWAYRPDGRTATTRRRLYMQFAVYYPAEVIGYRYALSASAIQSLKIVNCGQYGAGQVVISTSRFMGFISGFINGSTGIAQSVGDSWASNPWARTIYHDQTGVDSGVPASPSTATEWLTRYGPLSRGLDQDLDNGYSSSEYLLYNRTQPSGWPDTRAATNGVPLVLDGWTTIEVFLEYNETTPAQSSIQMWAAPYGEAPTLIIDEIGTLPLNSNASNSWSRFELLNYDTEREPNPGGDPARPTFLTNYDEVIVSLSPINFPGNFQIPNHQGGPNASGLETAAAALAVGGSSTYEAGIQNQMARADCAWNTEFHYWRDGREFHAMGKDVAGNPVIHIMFDEATETWSTVSSSVTGSGETGHIYGNFTMNLDTGDLYYHLWGNASILRYLQSAQVWDTISAPTVSSPPRNGLAWHPNLYSGAGGLVEYSRGNATTGASIRGWNSSTSTWTLEYNPGGGDGKEAAATYISGLDSVFGGADEQNGQFPLVQVAADFTVTVRADPPIQIIGGGTSGPHGTIVEHPRNSSVILLIENDGFSNRFWMSSDSGASWQQQTGTHPLGSCAIYCTIPQYGIVWGISGSEDSASVIWKVPDPE